MNKPGRTHHIRNRIITVILILAAAFCFGFVQWNSRIHYYSDKHTTGNTSTNLLNGGLFAESGDTIYFANPYDQNSLYSMDKKLSHVKKLHDDYTSYINAAGRYIFYTRRNDKKGTDSQALFSFSTTGLYRINSNGQGLKQLYREPSQSLSLLGNHIFYHSFAFLRLCLGMSWINHTCIQYPSGCIHNCHFTACTIPRVKSHCYISFYRRLH